jgi:hypothetical protein
MKTLKKAAIPSLMFVYTLLVTIFTITACDNGLGDTQNFTGGSQNFTVSYDAGAGNGTPPASQNVSSGETIYLPGQRDMTAPSGQTFNGWRTTGQSYSAGGSFTVTGNTIFWAQWTSTESGQPTAPASVQSLLNKVITQQESDSSAEFHSANYDPDLKYIVLTYKVGTIKNMFLQYLSKAVIAEAGREFIYKLNDNWFYDDSWWFNTADVEFLLEK